MNCLVNVSWSYGLADLFDVALSRLPVGQWGIFGPLSFKQYLLDNKLPAADTAARISVDSMEKLSASLRSAQVMVLRLGSASVGRGTQFALISTANKLEQFFLIDTVVDNDSGPVTYIPESSFRSLFPYFVIPGLTESSMVNLGFAAGVFGYGLELDPPYPTAAAATGNSTYSFRFRAHRELEEELVHVNGQVEIDAAFIGKRKGKDFLFVLETKSNQDKSLAKHKLVYAILALAPYVPMDIPIIPVYVRVICGEKDIRYLIAECQLPDPRRETIYLTDLEPLYWKYISVPIPRLK